MGIQWEDRYDQLNPLGDDQLLHLARNESAQYKYRLTAVEILQSRGSKAADHPELRGLVTNSTPVEPVEVTHESEITPAETDFGPLKASVTTETMFQPEAVQKLDTEVPSPADEAPISETEPIQEN